MTIVYKTCCPHCGYSFQSQSVEKKCPACSFHHLLVHYVEDGVAINEQDYLEIQSNYQQRQRHERTCDLCETTHSFYSTQMHISCHCGGWYQNQVTPIKVDAVKKCRNSLNLTQKQLALKLGITQGYLSEIEAGLKPVPLVIKLWVNRNIANRY